MDPCSCCLFRYLLGRATVYRQKKCNWLEPIGSSREHRSFCSITVDGKNYDCLCKWDVVRVQLFWASDYQDEQTFGVMKFGNTWVTIDFDWCDYGGGQPKADLMCTGSKFWDLRNLGTAEFRKHDGLSVWAGMKFNEQIERIAFANTHNLPSEHTGSGSG